jgi:hypothetical protein
MIAVCEEEGLTQAQFIERLLERELTERSFRCKDFTFLIMFILSARLLMV